MGSRSDFILGYFMLFDIKHLTKQNVLRPLDHFISAYCERQTSKVAWIFLQTCVVSPSRKWFQIEFLNSKKTLIFHHHKSQLHLRF